MSHFSVLVIGEDVDGQLQPYHKYECTGVFDEHVVFVNCEDEVREDWNTEIKERWKDLSTGEHYSPMDDQFYREPTEEEEAELKGSFGYANGITYTTRDWGDGKGRRPKVPLDDPPEGFERIEVSLSEIYFSIEEYAKDWHGYDIEDGVIGRWTNPNDKWDWWIIGGRWSNMLRTKPITLLPSPEMFDKFGFSQAEFLNLVQRYRRNKDEFKTFVQKYKGLAADIESAVEIYCTPVYPEPIRGHKGVLGAGHSNDAEDRTDSCTVGQLDIEQMQAEAVLQAETTWAQVQPLLDQYGAPPSWESFRKEREASIGIDDIRQEYGALEPVKAFREADLFPFMSDVQDVYFLNSENPREKFIENARDNAFSTFAVVKDGQWYERGEMGWWGMVTDEDSQYDWCARFRALIEDLPADTTLTIVDCHI